MKYVWIIEIMLIIKTRTTSIWKLGSRWVREFHEQSVLVYFKNTIWYSIGMTSGAYLKIRLLSGSINTKVDGFDCGNTIARENNYHNENQSARYYSTSRYLIYKSLPVDQAEGNRYVFTCKQSLLRTVSNWACFHLCATILLGYIRVTAFPTSMIYRVITLLIYNPISGNEIFMLISFNVRSGHCDRGNNHLSQGLFGVYYKSVMIS